MIFNPIVPIIVPILMAAFVAALVQFLNQYKLHKATPNSAQRKLCFVGASVGLSLAVLNVIGYTTYKVYRQFGMPPGRLEPFEWPIPFALLDSAMYVINYIGCCIIVLASLHRYHRLCAVAEGTLHEKLFLIAKYGSVVAAGLASISNIVDLYLFKHLAFVIVSALTLGFMATVDFTANYYVFPS
jgi:hypothetical protein